MHAEHAVTAQFELDIGDQETSGNTLPRLREMTFNITTGEASSRQVADTICDFPRVPLDLVGESLLPFTPSCPGTLPSGHPFGDQQAFGRHCLRLLLCLAEALDRANQPPLWALGHRLCEA